MRKAVDEPGFIFHPKCKELGIINVCFADDIFIVCGANETTVKIVSNSLKMFGALSGLKPNQEKSILPLIDGILGNVEAWRNRHLSFVGRLV
ncbi:hypothetical protein LIER_22188 [Lithospermum erythrorhizon]|uniref:Reverse transcriptase n=1 Tax=Lithospermum erythrorhizon TaxID=34254 RepID=A0AAV3QVY4_LITER